MVTNLLDLTGMKFGYLTVLHRTTSSQSGCARWVCQCDCGNVVARVSQHLRVKTRVNTRSCGCAKHGNTTHGMASTRQFRIWAQMKRRCLSEANKDWKNYGGRGIKVCDRWLESFTNFWEDMQDGYSPELSLDRINVNGHYEPTNCRWATVAQQCNNTRFNKKIQTPKGEMTIAQAARAYGIKVVTLHARIFRYNWPVHVALHQPTTCGNAALGLGLPSKEKMEGA